MSLKRQILKSPVAKIAMIIQAKILAGKVANNDSTLPKKKTVYCISPYKTGTTYIATCFNQELSRHEPLHYLSLINLQKDFDGFFVKRLNYLDLKIECSGFWSAYISELAHNKVGKDLDYICVLRSPSSWVTSVVNHWNSQGLKELYFDYVNELFWKQKVGVDLHTFFEVDENAKNEIIEKLITFYFDFTNNIRLLKNVTFFNLKDLDENLASIGSLIQEIPKNENGWKREGTRKDFVYKDEAIDIEYKRLTEGLIR